MKRKNHTIGMIPRWFVLPLHGRGAPCPGSGADVELCTTPPEQTDPQIYDCMFCHGGFQAVPRVDLLRPLVDLSIAVDEAMHAVRRFSIDGKWRPRKEVGRHLDDLDQHITRLRFAYSAAERHIKAEQRDKRKADKAAREADKAAREAEEAAQ